jgi:hypothetical protein
MLVVPTGERNVGGKERGTSQLLGMGCSRSAVGGLK